MASIAALLLLLGGGGLQAEEAAPFFHREPELQAAFVRKGDLWIKTGRNEKKVTETGGVLNPKWSADAQWIAYTKGEEQRELWLLHVPTGKNTRVTESSDINFQWAPDRAELAYQTEQQLLRVPVGSSEPETPVKVADAIGNFSWLPDGRGFVASSAAKLQNGWAPMSIVKLSLAGESETLYVLPKPSNEFLAVATSGFKWSASGRWMAFLAKPTASLSADSNVLCLLSADGKVFQKVDQMVNNEQWIQWSPEGDKLAYIGGPGREATSNKHLKVVAVPDGKAVPYTPSGYVDQGLTWQGTERIIVSRAKEMKAPTDGEAEPETRQKPFPSLVGVKLEGGKDYPVTLPSTEYGDYQPQSLPSKQLVWVMSDRSYTSHVMTSGPDGKHAFVWIENIDLGANYYEQWHWNLVLAVVGSR